MDFKNLLSPPEECISKICRPDVKKGVIKGTYTRKTGQNIKYEFETRVMDEGGFSRIHKGSLEILGKKKKVVWKVVTDAVEGLREAQTLLFLRDDPFLRNHIPVLFEVFYHTYLVSKEENGRPRKRKSRPKLKKLVIIVMEYIEGESLGDHIANDNFNTDVAFFPVATELTQVIDHLHQLDTTKLTKDCSKKPEKRGIAHRDLKLENILLRSIPTDSEKYLTAKIELGENKEKFEVVLIDFGMSVSVDSTQQEDIDEDKEDFCGTKYYMPPEILYPIILINRSAKRSSRSQNGKKMYDPRARDLWALGVIFWLMMGEESSTFSEELTKSEKLQGYLRAFIFPTVNNVYYSGFYYNTVLRGLMHAQWDKRWTADETLKYLAKVPLKITLKNKVRSITPQQLMYISFSLSFVYTGDSLHEWIREIEDLYPNLTKSRLKKLENELDKMIASEEEGLCEIVLDLWSIFIQPMKDK